jgi:hypothetical protein
MCGGPALGSYGDGDHHAEHDDQREQQEPASSDGLAPTTIASARLAASTARPSRSLPGTGYPTQITFTPCFTARSMPAANWSAVTLPSAAR